MPEVDRSLWVGFVDVTFDDGPDEHDMVGAFVWAMCAAESTAEFEAKLRAEFALHGATPTAFSDVEPLSVRKQRERLSRALNRLEYHAKSSGLALGTWHCYPEDA